MANWSDAADMVRSAEESLSRKYGPAAANRMRRALEIHCPICGAGCGRYCEAPANVEVHPVRVDTARMLELYADERQDMLRGRS